MRVRDNGKLAAERGRASSMRTKRRQKKAVVQSLLDTCRAVFADSRPGFPPSQDDVARLSSFLGSLKPEDFGLNPTLSYFRHENSEGPPSITYLHLYACPQFSIGIFCLPQSAVIPLHDHPGMTVFSKLLFGSMHIKSYDWVAAPHNSDEIASLADVGKRLAKVKKDAVFKAPCETLILYPRSGGNMHRFTAAASCAVLDVLGPPYSVREGRDCTYYDDVPYTSFPGRSIIPDEDQGRYAWLIEKEENPAEFNLEIAKYTGPKIVDK